MMMDFDLFLVFGLIVAFFRAAASLLLLTLIGVWCAIANAIQRARPAMLAYTRFLFWAFGTREAQRHRIVVYGWFIGVALMYLADLASVEPGFPLTGNLLVFVMFPIAALAVFVDHCDYFWKHSSKPA